MGSAAFPERYVHVLILRICEGDLILKDFCRWNEVKKRSYRIREIPKSNGCSPQMEMAMWRDRQTGKRVTWLWGVVELQAKGCQGLQAITGSQEMGMEQSFLPSSQGQHGLADLQLWFPVCGGAPELWENTFLLSEGSLLWWASKTNATLVGYLHLSDQGSLVELQERGS